MLYVAFLSMHMSSPLMNDLENYVKNLKYDTNYIQWEIHGIYFIPFSKTKWVISSMKSY